MNIKYLPMQNQACVMDEFEKIRKIPLTTNLDEKLETENKIEILEQKISENQKTKEEADRKKFKWKSLWRGPACILTFIILGQLCYLLLISKGNVNISDLLEDIILVMKAMSIIGTYFGVALLTSYLVKAKSAKKKVENAEFTSYFLENELKKEKEHLETIKQTQQLIETESKEEALTYIDNKKIKEHYREYLNKLASYGYRMKKVRKMYTKNSSQLEQDLMTDGINIELFESFLEENKRVRKLG